MPAAFLAVFAWQPHDASILCPETRSEASSIAVALLYAGGIMTAVMKCFPKAELVFRTCVSAAYFVCKSRYIYIYIYIYIYDAHLRLK